MKTEVFNYFSKKRKDLFCYFLLSCPYFVLFGNKAPLCLLFKINVVCSWNMFRTCR